MRNCPTCGFLVDDAGDDEVAPGWPDAPGVDGGGPAEASVEQSCGSCLAERAARVHVGAAPAEDAVLGAGSAVHAAAEGPPTGVGTTLLERPTAVPVEHVQVRYRSRARRRSVVRLLVVLALMGAALAALVVFDARRDGPLTEQLVRLGVVEESIVSVPDEWGPVELDPASGGALSLEAELPGERSPASVALVAPGPPGAELTGVEAPLGPLGNISTLSSDLGGTAGGLDDVGLSALAGAFVAAIPGEELSRRAAPIGDGTAIDLVVVATGVDGVARFGAPPRADVAVEADPTAGGPIAGDAAVGDAAVGDAAAGDANEGDSAEAAPPMVTTRVRVLLVGDRFVALVTSGVDDGAARLDAAHRRLLESFTVDR